jgi:tetratricopeptide (TPR) repeat protein
VRSLIFQCLEHKAKTSKCKKCTKRAAFELAFCYYIGFGTASNHQLAESWACKAGKKLEDLEDEKDEVIDYDFNPNSTLNELRHQHFGMIMDHTNEYRRPDYNLKVVLETLQREIRDLDEAFETQFMLTTTMRGVLAGVYLGAGHTDDAERIYRQLVDFFEQDPDHGPTHSDTWSSQQHLAEILRQGGKLGEAEEVARRCLTNRKKLNDVNNPGIIECKATLGSILFDGERFDEAMELFIETHRDSTGLLGTEHPQTLFAMSNLACAYRAQGLLAEAEDLDFAVLEIKKRIFGNEGGAHFSTVTSAANLAFTYSCQKRWDEAEKLEIWVLKERAKTLGELHPATLLAREQLAETYYQQGKDKDAQAVFEVRHDL